MWWDQVRQLDKLVLERRRHVLVLFLALRIVLVVVPVHLNAFLARTPWATSSALGGCHRLFGVVHGDGRDRAPLGIRDVQQAADHFVLLLEFRNHVLGRRNATTRFQERLERRFLSNRRQRYKMVGVALPELLWHVGLSTREEIALGHAHLGFEFTKYVGRVKGDGRVSDDFRHLVDAGCMRPVRIMHGCKRDVSCL